MESRAWPIWPASLTHWICSWWSELKGTGLYFLLDPSLSCVLLSGKLHGWKCVVSCQYLLPEKQHLELNPSERFQHTMFSWPVYPENGRWQSVLLPRSVNVPIAWAYSPNGSEWLDYDFWQDIQEVVPEPRLCGCIKSECLNIQQKSMLCILANLSVASCHTAFGFCKTNSHFVLFKRVDWEFQDHLKQSRMNRFIHQNETMEDCQNKNVTLLAVFLEDVFAHFRCCVMQKLQM